MDSSAEKSPQEELSQIVSPAMASSWPAQTPSGTRGRYRRRIRELRRRVDWTAQTHDVVARQAARSIAGVDHQRSVAHDQPVVDGLVIGRNDDTVAPRQSLLGQRRAMKDLSLVAHFGNVRVME